MPQCRLPRSKMLKWVVEGEVVPRFGHNGVWQVLFARKPAKLECMSRPVRISGLTCGLNPGSEQRPACD